MTSGTFSGLGRRLAALALCGLVLTCPLSAQAAAAARQVSVKNASGMELEVSEMTLEITADDPRPKAYLYPSSSSSDYYFVVWMSSNPTVASVDGDGKVTGRSAGTATITAISDRGDRAACTVTVIDKGEETKSNKPALDPAALTLTLKYNDLNPTGQLKLANNERSYLYVYRWMSSNPEVASVDDKGLVTAKSVGTATVTALISNGQALRCSVTVESDIGKVTLNKNDLLLRTAGSQETLTATVAVENGDAVPITWVSSNPGVATVDENGTVTAVADGEAKITALSPEGRSDVCSVAVGIVAEKYATEEELSDELKLPNPSAVLRLSRSQL